MDDTAASPSPDRLPPERTEILRFAAGEVLFREGEPGDCAYILLDGLVEITRRIGPVEVVISPSGPGDMIGEMALIDHAPRSATARAVKPTSVRLIPRTHFETILQTADPELRHMLERFVGIIRHLTEHNLRLTAGLR